MANKTVQASELSEGRPSPAALRLVGSRSGMLAILGFAGVGRGSGFMCCRCDCGKEFVARVGHLSTGRSRSCGCVRGAKLAKYLHKHGYAVEAQNSRVYRIWRAMCRRCTAPRDTAYRHYGGRGIRVCERWRDFRNFLADMGEPGVGMSIDRINNNGNYEPGNCRWATDQQQAENNSSNWHVSLNGESMTVAEATRRLNAKYARVYKYLYRLGASKNECVPLDSFAATL